MNADDPDVMTRKEFDAILRRHIDEGSWRGPNPPPGSSISCAAEGYSSPVRTVRVDCASLLKPTRTQWMSPAPPIAFGAATIRR
jgi:hypothetical protein